MAESEAGPNGAASDSAEAAGRSGSRIALRLAIATIGVIGAAAAWYLLRPTRTVVFAELLYQQSFAAFEDELSPSLPHPRNGYYLTEGGLYPATGEAIPVTSRLVAGIGFHYAHVHPPRDLLRTLRGADGGVVSWSTADDLGLSAPDAFSRRRLDLPLRLEMVRLETGEQVCAVQIDGHTQNVAQGERAVIHTAREDHRFEEYLASLPGARPTDRAADERERASLARILDPEGDGRITIHGRVVLRCHGPVSLHRLDLADLWREARRASREGRFAAATEALTDYLEIVPRDHTAQRLLGEAEDAVAEGRMLHRLSGRLSFAPGSTPPEQPALVSLRVAGGSSDQVRRQVFAVGETFEFFVSPGDYEVECAPRGYRARVVPVPLQANQEVDCAFGAGDLE